MTTQRGRGGWPLAWGLLTGKYRDGPLPAGARTALVPGLAGRLTDDGHVLPVRIYYEDTDFSGVVYHAAYLKFAERGRSDFLRLCGIHHAALEAGTPDEAFYRTKLATGRFYMKRRLPATALHLARIESGAEPENPPCQTSSPM